MVYNKTTKKRTKCYSVTSGQIGKRYATSSVLRTDFVPQAVQQAQEPGPNPGPSVEVEKNQ